MGTFFLLLFSSLPSVAKDQAPKNSKESGPGTDQVQYLSELLSQAEQTKLSDSLGWKRILFIPDRWYPSDKSLIDDPTYFIASDGRTNPKTELEATLRAFFESKLYGKKQSQCRYPARYAFLDRVLKFDSSRMKRHPCKDLKRFTAFADYSSVSLVFSNYFVNSPGSMFGHTLFKLHRERKEGQSDLLDDSLNFAAFVPVMNPLFYPFQGLLGYFPGRFTMLPYYRKIQEYSNDESRDLWEYELNLTKDEIDLMMLIASEIGETHFDYYYLDDNCSFVLLMMLEAVRPSLRLTKDHWVYAIPADTVRSVTDQEGLVKSIRYKPSALSRYMQRFRKLKPQQKEIFQKTIAENENPKLEPTSNCDLTCLTEIADTALEFIDFEEKLVGSKKAVRFDRLRQSLLSFRASSQMKSLSQESAKPESTPPHKGHSSHLIAFSAGRYDSFEKESYEFNWRPALHDLSSDEEGYSNEMQILFLDTHFRMLGKKIFLKELNFLDLTSVPRSYPFVDQAAWSVNLGYKDYFQCLDRGMCQRFNLTIGRGASASFWDDRILTYGLFKVDLLFSNDSRFHFDGAPLLSAGALYSQFKSFKLNFEIDYRIPFVKGLDVELDSQIIFTKYLFSESEIKLIYEMNRDWTEGRVAFRTHL